MRNNYFLRWTQRMMFLFTLLCGLSMAAQSSFSISFPSFSSAPTANPRNLVVCNSFSKLQVQLDVTTASTTGASVTIQLGAGVEYVPGSVAVVSTNAGLTIVDDGGTPNAPKFKVGPNALALANRLVFTIDRKATCATRTAALAGTAFKDTVTGSITGATATTEVSSTYSVTYPVFSFSQPATQTNAVLNTNYTRTFTISNGGSGGATEVYFSIDYPSNGIQNVSVSLTGGTGSTGTPLTLTPVSTSGTTAYYTIPAANLTGGSLDFGETLTLTEVYKIKICNASTNYTAGWGCDAVAANWCQTVTGTGGTSMATGVPNFGNYTASTSGYVDGCTPFGFTATFGNVGSGNATAAAMYNVKLRLGGGSSATLSTYNFDYANLSNALIGTTSVPLVGGNTASIASIDLKDLLTTDPDGAGVGLEDVDGDGFYDDLPAGKTVTITTTVNINCNYISCSSGDFYANNGVHGDIQYNTMCAPTTTVTSLKASNVVSFTTSFVTLSNKSYAPANISNLVPFQARFSVGYYLFGGLDTANTRYVYEITLPTGLSVSGTGNLKWRSGQYPDNASTAGTTITYTQVGNVLTITSPNKNIGWVTLDLVYDCGVGTGGAVNVPYTLKRLDNIVTGCTCNSQIYCSNLVLANVICPAPCPSGGVAQSLAKVEREDNSLGWTDATLSTRQNRASISSSDLAKALYLDEIGVYLNGTQQTIPSNNLFAKFNIKKNTGTDNKLTPIDLVVTIKRGATTLTTQTLTSFSMTASTTTNQIID